MYDHKITTSSKTCMHGGQKLIEYSEMESADTFLVVMVSGEKTTMGRQEDSEETRI